MGLYHMCVGRGRIIISIILKEPGTKYRKFIALSMLLYCSWVSKYRLLTSLHNTTSNFENNMVTFLQQDLN